MRRRVPNVEVELPKVSLLLVSPGLSPLDHEPVDGLWPNHREARAVHGLRGANLLERLRRLRQVRHSPRPAPIPGR